MWLLSDLSTTSNGNEESTICLTCVVVDNVMECFTKEKAVNCFVMWNVIRGKSERALNTRETGSGVYIYMYVILHSNLAPRNALMRMLTCHLSAQNNWKVKIVVVHGHTTMCDQQDGATYSRRMAAIKFYGKTEVKNSKTVNHPVVRNMVQEILSYSML